MLPIFTCLILYSLHHTSPTNMILPALRSTVPPPFIKSMLFSWLMVSSVLQKLFSLMGSYLLIVDLTASTIDVLLRKLSPAQCVQGYSPLLLLSDYVHVPLVEAFDPFGVAFCAGWWIWIFAFFYMWISTVTNTNCWQCRLYPPSVYYRVLYQKSGIHRGVDLNWFHWSIYLFLCQYHRGFVNKAL